MREILFRGKRKDNGEWSFGDLLHSNTGKTYIVELVDDDSGRIIRICHIEVNPTTIGQYTGLTDKNGVKIFEGDVLKTNTDSVITPKWVNRSNKHHCAQFIFSTQGVNNGWVHPLYGIGSEWEVIGNIHDKEVEE